MDILITDELLVHEDKVDPWCTDT